MQTSKYLVLVALSAASTISFAQATAPKVEQFSGSVATVEKLLKSENNALSGAGLPATPTLNASPIQFAPTLRVSSIYGTTGALRATVNFNGAEYENIHVGSSVGGYTVASIAGKCVTLASSKQKKKAKGISDCWTGIAPTSPSLVSSGDGAFGAHPAGVGMPLLPQGLPSGLTPAPLSPVAK